MITDDSIETNREDSHQFYQHENIDQIDLSHTRKNLEYEDTLDAPLADTLAAEAIINRGTDIEHFDLETYHRNMI